MKTVDTNPHNAPERVYHARETALRVLTACAAPGVRADTVLRAQLDRAGFSPADAALCTRIVCGVFQTRLLLDFYLSAFCTQKLSGLQEPLADILRIGAYQILFMDRVPDHAAVDEAVELTRKSGRARAAGLVNAVLRTLARNRTALPKIPKDPPERDLSLRYSHPLWLVRRLIKRSGAAETERFLAANQTIPPLTVRINPLRVNVTALIAELSAEGMTAKAHEWVGECVEVSGAGDITRWKAFREGKCFVQDPAAALVTQLADIRPGQRVLDVCAAPGGKSFAAAIAMKNDGLVLSCDVNAAKLERVRDGAERLGLARTIRTQCSDGRANHPDWREGFDVVLVDAPCSGLGTIRKKPDIRYRDEREISGLIPIQRAILDNAAGYVRPGGTLIYSTCTILPEENQRVTAEFLRRHEEFSPYGFTLPVVDCPDGEITLWPQRHNTDGFYIRRMDKRL